MPSFLPGMITLLMFQLGGEVVSRGFGLPMPGPVLGMIALVLALVVFPRLLDIVRPAGIGLLQHLSLLFVPIGVGVVARLSELSAHGLAFACSLIGSTILALCVGAVTFEWVARLTNNVDDEE